MPKSNVAFLVFTLCVYAFAQLGDYLLRAPARHDLDLDDYSLDFVDADLKRRVHAFGSPP